MKTSFSLPRWKGYQSRDGPEYLTANLCDAPLK
jgi:hypothetical protein